MKNTRQKEVILEAVSALRNHPTAEDIYSALKTENKKLSLGTVYRNLNRFAEAGKVLKLTVPNAGDRFDFRLDKHEHMQCQGCGKVFDVNTDVKFNDIDDNDMRITGYKLMFYGICPDCRREAGE